jgi:S1-C subfamily serine protease
MSYRIPSLTALALLVAGSAAAQVRPAAAPSCSGGQPAVGDLGYSGLSCNCTLFTYDSADAGQSVWRFRSEPRIEGVKRLGPADGKLRRGDLIVAIDGVLITSDEGGRRFAQVAPDQPVRLTVRREERETTVEITPAADCPSEPPTPRVAPAAPTPPAAVERRHPTPAPDPPQPTRIRSITVPPVPPAPKLASRAWLGFSLRCSHCGWSQTENGVAWEFSEPPVIEQVEADGPAARAGLRDGDRITHIDGLDITTGEAGTRFGAVEPGERVAFGVRRGAEALTVTLRAGEPLAREAGLLRGVLLRGRLTPEPSMERFTGTLGDALIEVTGGVVSVIETDDEIVIRGTDITVRIRRTGTTR